jgi:hypothetical protein
MNLDDRISAGAAICRPLITGRPRRAGNPTRGTWAFPADAPILSINAQQLRLMMAGKSKG